MKKNIYLFWYSERNHFNFGDDINPYIIEKLSNKKVKRVMVFSKKRNMMLDFMKMTIGIVQGRYKLSVYIEYLRSLTNPDYIVCIGSILHYGFSGKAKIWGSGIIHKESQINNSKFHAVRGLKTKDRIESLGYNFDGRIGDPALLLPLIYNPSVNNSNKIGIIPHVIHYSASKKLFGDKNKYILIDLSDNDIEKTIELIKSCRYVLSSSLHGLIVSHAYNVHALRLQLDGDLAGDGIKFLDYYSSVGIEDYEPVKMTDFCILNHDYYEGVFERMRQFSLPLEGVVHSLQRDLLSVAPFDLAQEYKIYI